jgi:plasmid stabilization system protein ParE
MPGSEVEWSQLALDNLDGILSYWREKAPDVGWRIGQAIFAKVDMIGECPEASRPVAGLSRAYREAFVEQYRILYRIVTPDRVRLICIRHGRQKPLTPDEIIALQP